ncbi:hypothetical protein [Phyllobacterium sp. P30BS-XVII]|uniref:hypothetical protein n=1 Tax=Phyllobacterium sp. P30BS-XVII TaxID=2587046 RepID=UPI0013AE891C|nr:hypothetical protein [Phyllobacterium sp. P30BS-XVII]MBA8903636.1 hypothetical protein [Phyllobacterium sp. P30BS-XVII]
MAAAIKSRSGSVKIGLLETAITSRRFSHSKWCHSHGEKRELIRELQRQPRYFHRLDTHMTMLCGYFKANGTVGARRRPRSLSFPMVRFLPIAARVGKDSEIILYISPNNVHLFDAETELAIR